MDRKLSITEWLLIINLVSYVILAIIGLSVVELNINVVAYVGQYNRFIFQYGYVWQLITALFVHFHLGHLLSNMLFLLLFGYRAEDFFTWSEYLCIYLASGLIGNLLGLVMGPEFLSAGASGAIFGLLGAILYPIKKESQRTFKSMIFIGFIFLVFSGMNYNVDHFSHWAGFIVGLLLGIYFTRKKHLKSQTKRNHILKKLYYDQDRRFSNLIVHSSSLMDSTLTSII
ncbi:MAG: rhomboid family intramembrane serine protease [Candidatus Helarchaeota archaeon]